MSDLDILLCQCDGDCSSPFNLRKCNKCVGCAFICQLDGTVEASQRYRFTERLLVNCTGLAKVCLINRYLTAYSIFEACCCCRCSCLALSSLFQLSAIVRLNFGHFLKDERNKARKTERKRERHSLPPTIRGICQQASSSSSSTPRSR